MSNLFENGKKSRSSSALKIFGVCAFILLIGIVVPKFFADEKIYLERVLIDRWDGFDGLSRSEIRQYSIAHLSDKKDVVLKDTPNPQSILRVSVGFDSFDELPEDKIQKLRIAVNLEAKDALSLESATVVSVENEEQMRDEVNRSIGENIERIIAQYRKHKSNQIEVEQIFAAYLANEHVSRDLLVSAIEKTVDERKTSREPVLLNMLQVSEPDIAIILLHALSEIGTRNSIPRILDYGDHKGAELRRHIIETVRKIGGEEAAAWLFTLSTGHPDERVRQAASVAFADVEMKMKKELGLVQN